MKAMIICEDSAIEKWDYLRLIKEFLERNGFSLVIVDYSAGRDIPNYDDTDLIIVNGIPDYKAPHKHCIFPLVLHFNSTHPKAINNPYLNSGTITRPYDCAQLPDSEIMWTYAVNQQRAIKYRIKLIKLASYLDDIILWFIAVAIAFGFIFALVYFIGKYYGST